MNSFLNCVKIDITPVDPVDPTDPDENNIRIVLRYIKDTPSSSQIFWLIFTWKRFSSESSTLTFFKVISEITSWTTHILWHSYDTTIRIIYVALIQDFLSYDKSNPLEQVLQVSIVSFTKHWAIKVVKKTQSPSTLIKNFSYIEYVNSPL